MDVILKKLSAILVLPVRILLVINTLDVKLL
jgi:hypothetical protein